MVVSSSDLSALLARDQAEFVREAYQILLQRPADGAGLAFYLDRLRSGATKQRVLAELASSKEAAPVFQSSVALQELVRLQGVRRRLSLRRLLRRIAPGRRPAILTVEQPGGSYSLPVGSDLTIAERAIHRRLSQAIAMPDEEASQ